MSMKARLTSGNALVEPQNMAASACADSSYQYKLGTAACNSPKNTSDLTDTNLSCASYGHIKCGHCTKLKDDASYMEYIDLAGLVRDVSSATLWYCVRTTTNIDEL